MTETSHDLVVCSLEAWDEVWRRNQFLIDGLLHRDEHLRVLFVEPASDPLHEIRRGNVPRLGQGLRVSAHSDRLSTYQPTKWLPRVAGPASDRLLRRQLVSAIRRAGMADPVLWINDPSWATLTTTGWPALYDITDDWVQAKRGTREHDRIVENERLLMQNCREVVVCSPGLVESKSVLREVTLIRNAVDVVRFRRPTERPSDLPAGPIALYLGTLHEDRLDVDLCASLADALASRGATLALVGPIALNGINTGRLRDHVNVWMPGARSNDTVPSYLQHADVLIVPHIVDEFTDSLDPIKLYEYLAVNLPVVSTPVAGFSDAETRVTIAPETDFVARVLEALDLRDRPEPDVDTPDLDVPDWGHRVDAMASVLDRLWRR